MPLTLSGTDQRLPLYARLRDVLASQIASQTWAVGAAIPPEHELAATFGVSVHTLRRAVQQLVDEGLLDRRQGSGTYVRPPSFDRDLFRWFNFEDAAAEHGRTVPESRLLKREIRPITPDLAERLRTPDAEEVVYILRARLWSGEILIVEEIHLPSPRYRALIDITEPEIGPLLYPIYERVFGDVVASVVDEITVGKAPAHVYQLLKLEDDSLTVHADRTSLRANGSPIEWRRAYGRADRFRYRVTLR